MDNLMAARVEIPTLKTLLIFEGRDDKNNCQVVITGANLRTFDYGGDLKNEYHLYDLSSLVDSSIVVGKISDIVEDDRLREVADHTNKLLGGLSNVRDLYLSHETVKVLNSTAEPFTHSNLTYLRVNLGSVNFNCGALQSILQKTPFLSNLEFMRGISLDTPDDEDEWKLDPVLLCFSKQLKTIYIGDFCGTEQEFHVAKNLLQNASVLERLCIQLASCKDVFDSSESIAIGSRCEICFHA
ncbi:hypothetical protein JCGZ_21251 [Jatropha curcas]|uniref:FBD domain-containing protein n=1 Tax=Jatropha curcas TaxID=180498 RepID=A0A067JLA8_JATCU|nr:hypothetical protein JCGZ_21251 [Jatropha curcas]